MESAGVAKSSHPSLAAVHPAEAGGSHEGELFDPREHRPRTHNIVRLTVVAALVLVGLLAAGLVPRMLRHSTALADEQRAAAETPRVRVARAKRVEGSAGLVLPGSVQPLQETVLYARANGYVRKWLVDIGADVKKGQVLAELDLPDVDEELRQAEASQAQAQAGISQAKTQLELARTTNRRYTSLGPSGVVSQQEVDQYQAQFDAQKSNVQAAEAAFAAAVANVRRYQDLKSFGSIVAPFDGVVTMRTAEIGQLVVAGTGQGQALFKVAEVDKVRVFVNVPQLYAGALKIGTDAPTIIREAPGRTFPGKVARTSNELDMATRSLLTEVDIPNPDRTLVSGMYAQVSFDVRRQDRPLSVPSTAILYDAQGTRAAVVHDGVVTWKKVEIESDSGDRLSVASGLQDGDLVAVTPSERLVEGMRVLPEEAPPDGAKAGAVLAKERPGEKGGP